MTINWIHHSWTSAPDNEKIRQKLRGKQLKKTLYDWLEVSPGASQEAISASFQRLSEKMNPDREENHFVPNAQSNFILLKEAYATLSDPLLRRAYDDK